MVKFSINNDFGNSRIRIGMVTPIISLIPRGRMNVLTAILFLDFLKSNLCIVDFNNSVTHH
jgi:hypothetical protein